jgi:hypothetical protein
VRDIQRVYGDRILLMLTEENPVFPQFNPDEDAWNGYNQLDRGMLADDIEEQAQRLSGILRELEPEDWSRTMTRDGGNDGVFGSRSPGWRAMRCTSRTIICSTPTAR